MDCKWLHCVFCSRFPQPDVKFFIGSCGDVACSKCVEKKLLTPKCSRCNRNTNMLEINADMKDTVKMFFSDSALEYEKFLKSVKKIADFQSKNYMNLINFKNKKIREMSQHGSNADKILIARLKREKAKLEADFKALQAETLNHSKMGGMMDVTRNLLAGTGEDNLPVSSFLNNMTTVDNQEKATAAVLDNNQKQVDFNTTVSG
uniref:RING-type domain-containing protein n=1 Tax=Panagrolaimus sp. JU765 TaxID=591449 RepID=A0AC34QQM1_9BILA